MLLDLIPDTNKNALKDLDRHRYKTRFTKKSISKLSELLDILADNSKVGHLINNVSVTSKIDMKAYQFNRSVRLQALFSTDPDTIVNNIFDRVRYPKELDVHPINICNFDMSFISDISGKVNYNKFRMCSVQQNVDHKVRVPNYFLNENSFRMCLGKTDGQILEIISIGKHNTLFAVITKNKKLYIRWPVLKSIMDKYALSRSKSIMINTLLRYNMYLKALATIDPLSGDFMNTAFLNGIIESSVIDNIKNVKDIIDEKIESFKNSFFKCSFGRDLEMYSKIIDNFSKNVDNALQKKLKNAFRDGMQLSSKLSLLGWRPSITKQSSSRGEIWFEKDVNIIPSILVWESVHYKIEPKDCPYKITKLFLNTLGVMHASGKHPNVSGGGVCMGDLKKIDFNLPENELKDAIERGARLLELINYDSPFDSSKRDILLEKATKLDIGESGHENIKTTPVTETTIRRIVTINGSNADAEEEVDDFLDELEEELEEENIPVEPIQKDENTTIIRRNGEAQDITNKLPGLKDVNWQKLADVLRRFDNINNSPSSTYAEYLNGDIELVYLFSIANTERYISISLSNYTCQKFSPGSLIESDFVVDYYRDKTSIPKKITKLDILELIEFLEPVFIKTNNTPTNHYSVQMSKFFGDHWTTQKVVDIWEKIKYFRINEVGSNLNV